MIEKISCSPSASVTYPDRELTEVSEPVLACTLFAAGVPSIRDRSVPPTRRSGLPAIGSAWYQVSNHGLERTLLSSAARFCGATRSARDSPEPSVMRSPDRPLSARNLLIPASPALQVPWPPVLRPMALTRVSAIGLFDSLRNGTASSDSGADSRLATSAAPAGVAPVVVLPVTLTPCACRA